MNVKDNYILCEYNINKEDLNKDTQILNYFKEDIMRKIINFYKDRKNRLYIRNK